MILFNGFNDNSANLIIFLLKVNTQFNFSVNWIFIDGRFASEIALLLLLMVPEWIIRKPISHGDRFALAARIGSRLNILIVALFTTESHLSQPNVHIACQSTAYRICTYDAYKCFRTLQMTWVKLCAHKLIRFAAIIITITAKLVSNIFRSLCEETLSLYLVYYHWWQRSRCITRCAMCIECIQLCFFAVFIQTSSSRRLAQCAKYASNGSLSMYSNLCETCSIIEQMQNLQVVATNRRRQFHRRGNKKNRPVSIKGHHNVIYIRRNAFAYIRHANRKSSAFELTQVPKSKFHMVSCSPN